MRTHLSVSKFQKKNFLFNFLIQLRIYLYLDISFLYYKGILAFIFEHTDIVIAFWSYTFNA